MICLSDQENHCCIVDLLFHRQGISTESSLREGRSTHLVISDMAMDHKRAPFECSDCGKIFKERNKLLVHNRVHTGERPFVCWRCKRTFTQNSSQKTHILNIHSTERPHKCEICGKAFKQKMQLKRHLRIHTGDLPFECEVCGKSFRHSSHEETF